MIKNINPSDLIELYKNSVRKYSRNTAFQIEERKISYYEFNKDVCKVIKHLKNIKEKNIKIVTENSYNFAVAYFATIISDNIAVLYPTNTSTEKILTVEEFTDKKIEDIVQKYEYEPINFFESYDKHKVSTILFSSGTTNVAKGIMLSMNNLIVNILGCLKKVSYYETDRCISIVPLNHILGLIGDLLITFHSGACMCVVQNKYQLFSSLKKYKPTYLNLPPVIIEKLLEEIEQYGIDVTGNQIRRIMSGGSSISNKIIEKFQKYSIQILPCYGLTETLCVAIRSEFSKSEKGVGKPLENCEIFLDKEGQIYVCSKSVMLGYISKDKINLKNVNGKKYLKTNDIGQIDDEGNLIILGRNDNIISLKNGEKITIEEIEQKIHEIEGVEDQKVIVKKNEIEVEIVKNNEKKSVEEEIQHLNFGGTVITKIKYVKFIKKNSLGKVIRNERRNN